METKKSQPTWITPAFNLLLCLVGIYRFHQAHTRTSQVLALFLIVAGAGLFVITLIANNVTRNAAKRTHELERGLYSTNHVRKLVDVAEIRRRRLDLAFYERATQELEALGYRKLEDFVDVTIDHTVRWAVSVLRALLSRDGTTMAG